MDVNSLPRKKKILDIFGRDPESLDDLALCVKSVIEYQDNVGFGGRQGQKTRYKVSGLSWTIRESQVSNSHHGPLIGKTNWSGRDKSVPTSYPGWHGRVWIRYQEAPRDFGSSPFSMTLTHTGTGGGGSYSGPSHAVSAARFKRYGHAKQPGSYPEIHCFSWDYSIFLDDWPGLKHNIERDLIIAELSSKQRDLVHKFDWIDPATAAADAQFLAECSISKQE